MRLRYRLKAGAIAYTLALLLGLCALAFASFALYLALARSMEAVIAALVTAAALLLLALLTLLIMRWTTRRGTSPGRRSRGGSPVDGLESVLEERADPVLSEWIRRHPERAALATLILGIAAGYSRSTRRVLQDLYDQYASAERERRSSRRDD